MKRPGPAVFLRPIESRAWARWHAGIRAMVDAARAPSMLGPFSFWPRAQHELMVGLFRWSSSGAIVGKGGRS